MDTNREERENGATGRSDIKVKARRVALSKAGAERISKPRMTRMFGMTKHGCCENRALRLSSLFQPGDLKGQLGNRCLQNVPDNLQIDARASLPSNLGSPISWV